MSKALRLEDHTNGSLFGRHNFRTRWFSAKTRYCHVWHRTISDKT